MYEVEIKVAADLDAIRERLRDAGAERVDARRQRDVYYDAPHRNFAETDEALRIRHETEVEGDIIGSAEAGGPETAETTETTEMTETTETSKATETTETTKTTKLTYKGPLLDDGSKTRAEHETAVADAKAAAGVFDGLGFEPAATVEKRREFWSHEGFTVTLDSVADLGEFVEIERAVDDEAAIGATRDEALDALDTLGLDGAEQIRTSYLGLLLADSEDD